MRSDHLQRHVERKHPTVISKPPPPLKEENVSYKEPKVDENVYVLKDYDKVQKNHTSHLPRDIRALIVGKSGCGKTTLLMKLLL